ncbi:MAG: SCO family protein [Desulfovibrionaceae bacterium]|nr:SCO family protein [Desulfovibrionaceae bacterium]
MRQRPSARDDRSALLSGAALALVLTIALALASPGACLAHDPEREHPADAQAPAAAQTADASVGVDEKLGDRLPADIVLRDENGASVNLRDLIAVPTLLVPVYYSCPNDCNMLLGSLSQILPRVALTPGRDFQVATFSFDETDTPELAERRKNDFEAALTERFPMQYWRFLTGDEAAIRKLTQAIGFRFARDGKAFRHPVVLVSVSPTGKIVRYLYGAAPLPFDLAMAATEAAGETVGLSVKRAVAFCYSYDPAGRRYVFDLMKIAGLSVLAGLGVFLLFLVFGGKKRTTRQPRP